MDDYQRRINNFLDELEDIEVRNIDYFLFRTDKNNERDVLANHYSFYYRYKTPCFKFVEESDLSNSIRKKCILCFNKHYPEGYLASSFFRNEK